MIRVLRELRKKFVIGFVGGSDLVKISEQLSVHGSNGVWSLLPPFLSNDSCQLWKTLTTPSLKTV